MVPAPGLEPGRPFGQGILSPLRLPIPPSGPPCPATVATGSIAGQRGPSDQIGTTTRHFGSPEEPPSTWARTPRSDERRVGKECVSASRSRGPPYQSNKNTTNHT